MKVKDFMTKGIISCDINDSLNTIAEIMSNNDVGFIAVLDEDEIVGVITDRDIVIGPILDNVDSISDYINKSIISIDSDDNIEKAFNLMKKNKINRLLVTKNDKYIGVVSIFDFLESEFISNVFSTIKEIKN
jgi:CBS domain-containing protein